MNEILFILDNKIKLIIELYNILNYVYIYYDNIYIFSNNKYFQLNNHIFFNINNVKIINEINDYNNLTKYTSIVDFKNNIDFNANNIELIPINRNLKSESIIYNKLVKAIGNEYIFYYNPNNDKKIINYFGKLYIFNPLNNFYDENHSKYNMWIDLNVINMLQYSTIIENSKELHIYDIDLLYLILELDTKHINNKFFYYHDILIKKNDARLKDWNIIFN